MNTSDNYDFLLCIGLRFDGKEMQQRWTRMGADGQPIGDTFAFAARVDHAHPGETWRFLKNPEGEGWALESDQVGERPMFGHVHSNRQLVNLLFLDEHRAWVEFCAALRDAAILDTRANIRSGLLLWVSDSLDPKG